MALTTFGQIESVMDRHCDGSGLDLPLVVSMVELHDGKFDIQSELGRGTTVTVTLPASRKIT
jgi:two-component system, cell cycle sensor histidine kinase PleC